MVRPLSWRLVVAEVNVAAGVGLVCVTVYCKIGKPGSAAARYNQFKVTLVCPTIALVKMRLAAAGSASSRSRRGLKGLSPSELSARTRKRIGRAVVEAGEGRGDRIARGRRSLMAR